MKKKYVLGFAFNSDLSQVVLIEKNRPEWQAGLLNGVGGKIEEYDQSVSHAMSREFYEEAGHNTDPEEWKLFATMQGSEFLIYCFWTKIPDILVCQAMTDEKIYPLRMDSLIIAPEQFCPNVPMLIQMARCPDVQNESIGVISINYKPIEPQIW